MEHKYNAYEILLGCFEKMSFKDVRHWVEHMDQKTLNEFWCYLKQNACYVEDHDAKEVLNLMYA